MYFNFFVTDLIELYEHKHYGPWYQSLSEYLIDTQAESGAERGSWYFPGEDQGAIPGGRLYFTALATLILQTPKRVQFQTPSEEFSN